jgi:hypothetical protein
MKLKISALVILFVSVFSYSQDISISSSDRVAKNAIEFSAGMAIVIINVSVSYERKLTSMGVRKESSLWVKGRYSKFSGWITEDKSRFFDATMFTLLGAGRSFAEISLGVGMFPYGYSVVPTLSLGYRFQKQGEGLIFRTGGGFPELIYLGLGYSF